MNMDKYSTLLLVLWRQKPWNGSGLIDVIFTHQNESRKDHAPPGLSFSAKYTNDENVSTATPTSNISSPSSLYAWKSANSLVQ